MSIHVLPRGAFATERLVVGAAAVCFVGAGISNPAFERATKAAVTCEDVDDFVFTVDGTTPTASLGHTWKASYGVLILDGHTSILKFRAIRAAAADSALNVTFFKE